MKLLERYDFGAPATYTIEESDFDLIVEQTGCSREIARKLLHLRRGDLVAAILLASEFQSGIKTIIDKTGCDRRTAMFTLEYCGDILSAIDSINFDTRNVSEPNRRVRFKHM